MLPGVLGLEAMVVIRLPARMGVKARRGGLMAIIRAGSDTRAWSTRTMELRNSASSKFHYITLHRCSKREKEAQIAEMI